MAAEIQDAGPSFLDPNKLKLELQTTQVVDISPKTAKSCVVSRLIFRRLGRKQAFFDPFIALKGVDLPPVTKKAGDFLLERISKRRSAETPPRRRRRFPSVSVG
jgi:hypothetical protein